MKVKKGDQVVIISGKDKGKKGKILAVFPREGKVTVDGVNMRKKHQRAKNEGEKGQIIEKPGAIYVSVVKLVCSKCGQAVRVSKKIINNRKYRICKKCGQEI